MDWRAVRFDWNHARAFLVTAEEGSLSAAARALGATQPTVGRQVAALERELGVVLFERVGRGLALTPSGMELAEQVRAMGDAAGRVSLAASGQSQSVEGVVRIAASEAAAAFFLPPIVARLRQAAPGVTVEIVASNSLSDLRRREADIAIRSVEPTDPALIARRLPDHTARLYATPAYLAGLGDPQTPEALLAAEFIGFTENEMYQQGLAAFGLPVAERRFTIISANHLVHWEMTKRGLGVGLMASVAGDAEPLVTRAAPWMAPFAIPVWLVAHRALNTSRRIRLVFDLLAEDLTALSAREARGAAP